nr:lymphocyte activation gene 3 protein [Zootoca vivipara]
MTLLFFFLAVVLNLQLTIAQNVPCAPGEACRVWAEEGGRALLPCRLSRRRLKSSSRQLHKGSALRWVHHGDRFAEPAVPVVYAAAGSDAHLPCLLNDNPTDYGISRVAVHWSYAARREPKAISTLSNGSSRNFTLHLPAVGLDDAGRYTCEVAIQGTNITKNITLAVMTVTPSTEGIIMEGSRLQLTCNLSYHTGKEHFTWKYLGLNPTNMSWPKAASKSFGLLSQGSTLEFSQVLPNDTGTWECSVHGPDGMSGSVQYRLEIAGARIALVQPRAAEKITVGLIAFLGILVSILALTCLKRRTRSRNFPALDLMLLASALPGKEVKDEGQKEKGLQI